MDNIQEDPASGDEEQEEDIPTFGGNDIVITIKENEGIFNLAIWRYYLKFFN